MAIVNVTQFRGAGAVNYAVTQAPIAPALAYEDVAAGVTNEQSAVFSDACGLVRVCADADVYIAIGGDPDASVEGLLLPQGAVEYFSIQSPRMRLAAIEVA